MFKIDSTTKNIEITRGDILPLTISALNADETDYTFQVGDVIRLKVFKNKDCGCVVLEKDVTVSTATEAVEMNVTGEETKIGELINKPVDYWYEVELNPETNPQTIIGYTNTEGPKLFTLLPEGGESNE